MTQEIDTENQEEDPKKDKNSWSSVIVMSVVALLFGWIVTKDVSLPTGILMAGFAIGGIIVFFKGMGNPAVVTYVLVAYLPFSRILVGDFGGAAKAINLTNLLMLFIIFVWAAGKFTEGESKWLSTPLNKPIILFTILGFISILRANAMFGHYVMMTITEYKRWITPFFLFFMVLNTVKKRETIRNVILIIIVTTTIVGLMAIYDYIDLGTVSRLEKARIGGITEQPNGLAAFFNYYMFLPFAFFLLNMKKPMYWLLLIPFLIQFRGIMVTFSRGGYLAFAVGLFAITFFRSKILFVFLLLATFLLYLNPQFLPGGIKYRMGQTVVQSENALGDPNDFSEDQLETSSRNRVEVWKGALLLIKDHPYGGVGYGLFQPMIRYYWSGGREIDAHNSYLSIAGEMGIPALIVFMWIIWLMIFYTRKLYVLTRDPFVKATALGFLGGLFSLLMSNMFGSRLISQEISSYIWILAALIMRFIMVESTDLEGEERARFQAQSK